MYYIDFDNTMYETGRLTKDILTTFAKEIGKTKDIDPIIILEELKKSFNSSVDNFESFASSLSTIHNIKASILQTHLKNIIITNGPSYIFPDTIDFLKKLKEAGEEVYILTYVANSKNIQQQTIKLYGSEVLPYVNGFFLTSKYKYELELDYQKGTFIDDSPRDLEGLYKAGARNIYRMNRPNNVKRTSKTLNLPENVEIPVCTSFNEIDIEKTR